LPSSIGANGITELIAHENLLYGTIPVSLFDNIDMRTLRLDNNNFGGSLSNEIGDLKNLAELRLGGNKFTGPIPASLWKLTKLRKYSTQFIFISCIPYLTILCLLIDAARTS
jgi:Leucine-rich repeat (LRR) protein